MNGAQTGSEHIAPGLEAHRLGRGRNQAHVAWAPRHAKPAASICMIITWHLIRMAIVAIAMRAGN